jgi:hypothetical protein
MRPGDPLRDVADDPGRRHDAQRSFSSSGGVAAATAREEQSRYDKVKREFWHTKILLLVL